MFKQGDPAWGDKQLGASGLSMKHFGCTVTDVAQALKLRGHDVDPGKVVDKLNSVGAFTKDGLLIWTKVTEAYPAFHFNGEGFVFVKGLYKKFQHWILRHNGVEYDPLFGEDHAPAGFVEISANRTASVDEAPKPTPPTPTPAPEPKPEPAPAPAPAPQPATYTVVKGDNLTHICKKHYGITDEGEAYRKALEVAKYNGIENPDLIYPGQVIKLP